MPWGGRGLSYTGLHSRGVLGREDQPTFLTGGTLRLTKAWTPLARSAHALALTPEQEERGLLQWLLGFHDPYQHTWPWLSESSAPTHSM